MFVKFVKYRYLDNFNFLRLRKRLLMKKYLIFFVEGLLKKYVIGEMDLYLMCLFDLKRLVVIV